MKITNGAAGYGTLIAGSVGIGSALPVVSLDLSQETDAVALPAGTTANRPGSAVNGMLRYNSTIPGVEAYINSAWVTFGAAGSGVTSFSGGTTGLTPASATTGAITLSGTLAIANGGTGQTTAAAARASSGLNIDEMTTHGDSAYTILTTDRTVATSAALSASRTWTLPAASAENAGQETCVADEAGGVTGTNTLVVAANGTDTINGTANYTLDKAYQAVCVVSDGTSKWDVVGVGDSGQAVTGSGATNYTARWLTATTLGTGTLYDNGTQVGIGTTTNLTQNLNLPNGGYLGVVNAAGSASLPVIGMDSSNYVQLASGGQPIFFSGGSAFLMATSINESSGSPVLSWSSGGGSTYLQSWSSQSLYLNSLGNDINFLNGKILMQSSTGNVGIGSASPVSSLDLSQKTDAVALPAGTTANRPTTVANGMLRYNSTIPGLEAYVNSGWVTLGTAGSGVTTLSGGTTGLTPSSATSGAITLAGTLAAANGGTGVSNSNTITLGGNITTAGALTTSGAYSLTLTTTGATNVTLPTSGTLVNTGVTSLTSLAGVGTITSGTWNGTAITVPYGGTGDATLTQYGVLLGNGTGAINATAVGATGTVLIGSSGANPIFSASPSVTNLTLSGVEALTFGTDYTTTGLQSDVAINTTSAVRYAGSGTATFYGIVAGKAGQILTLHNASSSALTLSNQSGSEATAANKIITGSGADLVMAANSSVIMQYDGAASLWRVISGSGTVSGSGTANYTARWLTSTSLGTGTLYDNGTQVGIGTASPTGQLTIKAVTGVTSNLTLLGTAGVIVPTLAMQHSSDANPEVIQASGGQFMLNSDGQGSNFIITPTYPDSYIQTHTGSSSKLHLQSHNGTSYQDSLVITNGNVGIGSTSPVSSLDISQETDAVALPAGTTANRPTTVANGMLRYNSTIPGVEAYVNSAWVTLGAAGSGVTSFSGGTTGLTPASATTGAITLAGTLAIANGGTGQTTAAAARGSSGLNIDEMTTHGDSAYTILTTDRTVATSAALTASRTWTLPAASAENAGQETCVADEAGGLTGTNTLVIAANGSDTINGAASYTMSTAYQSVCLVSDGSSKWDIVGVGDAGQPMGSGTANYTARWLTATTLGTGTLYDNGTQVGIGTTSPGEQLTLTNNLWFDVGPSSTTSEIKFGTDKNQPSIQNDANTELVIWNSGLSHTFKLLSMSGSTPNIYIAGVFDGANAVGHILDTHNTLSTAGAKLLSIRNAGTEKAYVDLNGGAYFNGDVGIGTTSPAVSLDLSKESDAVALPAGTTANRPTTVANGMLRYNSTIPGVEAYVNSAWVTLGAAGSGVTSFSGGTTGLTPASATTGAITLAGTLGVANGGTGDTTLTQYGVLLGNGTGAINATAVGATGTVLIGSSGANPIFSASPSVTNITYSGLETNSLSTDYTPIGTQVAAPAVTTGSSIRVVSATAATEFYGIPAGVSGQILRLHNASGYALTLGNQNTSATAANRIYTGTGADLVMANNSSVQLQYDATAANWRVIGGSGSGSSTLAGDTDVSLSGLASGQLLAYNGTKWVNEAVNTAVTAAVAPSFMATNGGTTQNVTSDVYSGLAMTTVTLDTNNNFTAGAISGGNATSIGKYTPTVAGSYIVTVSAYCQVASINCLAVIYKNGSIQYRGSFSGSNQQDISTVTAIINMNGTTDYLQAYVYAGGSSPTIGGTTTDTFFSGGLLAPLASGSVAGTGTANYTARWTSGTNIGTGTLYDNGTQVGIGTTSIVTGAALDLSNNTTSANSSLVLPAGTSANRPATGAVGMLRYNQSTSSVEAYQGSTPAWVSLGSGVTTLSGGTTGLTPSSATSGAITLAGTLAAANGGTGVSNSNTITLGGNITTAGALTTSGAYSLTLTTTGATNVTLPTSGTLVNTGVTSLTSLAGVGTITSGTWNGTTIAVANGGTGQTTAAAARGSSGLDIDEMTTHGDSAYTILTTDRTVATSAALTASRTWTLPAASTDNAGQETCVADKAGGVTGTNTLVIAANGSDTINGAASYTLNTAYQSVCLVSDGSSKWALVGIGNTALVTGAGTSNYTARWTSGTTIGTGALTDNGTLVGIGTASTTSMLYTYDSAAKTANYTGILHDVFDTSSTTSVNKIGMDIESTGSWTGTTAVNTGLVVNATGGTTNYAATFSGGDVGIGTTEPGYGLDVNGGTGDGDIRAVSGASSNVARLLLENNGTSGHHWDIRATNTSIAPAGGLSFVDNTIPATRMVIDSSGNVGIGTTNPQAVLNVNGTFTVGTGVAEGLMTEYWNNSTQDGITLQATTTTFTGSPIVFLNSSSAVSGYISQTATTVVYNTASDRRLKENIAPTSRGLDTLLKIEPTDFNFIADPKKERVQGFIAQDLYKIYPEAVTVGGDDPKVKPWAVDYGRLTPLVVKSVEELKALFDKLAVEVKQIDDHIANQIDPEVATLKTANDNQAKAIEELKAAVAKQHEEFEAYKKTHP